MFVLPLGDEPNPPDTPLATYALILVNCAAYLLITLPLGAVRPEWADPMVQEYLRAWVEALPEPVSRRDVAAMYQQLTGYDLFVYRWGFRAAEPSLATLFSAMFLHAGFLHLLGNMLFLWICGDNVEHRLGRVRFLVLRGFLRRVEPLPEVLQHPPLPVVARFTHPASLRPPGGSAGRAAGGGPEKP